MDGGTDMTGLDGQVVVITGAESGIGAAIATACATAGARVLCCDLEARGVAEGLKGAAFARTDVNDPGSVAAALATAEAQLGQVTAVVANAGHFGRPWPVEALPAEDWAATLALNLTGSFTTLQAGARHLIEAGRRGSLLATGSSLALRPQPQAHAYAAAKAGVHALVRSMALELGPRGIRVNAIAPGVTRTPATEAVPGYLEAAARDTAQGEVAEPSEVGALAATVLSESMPHMTGAILSLDSGYTI
jgi:NAD(P)-dependent dehydrogenase (short-subunit alcohol dehydrogenase family)